MNYSFEFGCHLAPWMLIGAQGFWVPEKIKKIRNIRNFFKKPKKTENLKKSLGFKIRTPYLGVNNPWLVRFCFSALFASERMA